MTMQTVRVLIEIDEGFRFWPVLEENLRWSAPTLEIDKALYDEYETAQNMMRKVQDKIEQLYRVQRNLVPHNEPEVPQHKVIT
jgi:hypothetical protein